MPDTKNKHEQALFDIDNVRADLQEVMNNDDLDVMQKTLMKMAIRYLTLAGDAVSHSKDMMEVA